MASFNYRLLVVDDEPSLRDTLQTSLSMQGYEVRVARDGFDALAQMRGALPDLILTDLKMPNMSGFEFLSVVRRRFPQIPTIAISGEFQPPSQSWGCSRMPSSPSRIRPRTCLQRLRSWRLTLHCARQSRGTDRRSGFPATGNIM